MRLEATGLLVPLKESAKDRATDTCGGPACEDTRTRPHAKEAADEPCDAPADKVADTDP